MNVFKSTLAAAALALLPAASIAATQQFNEGGLTLIELDNTYEYANDAILSGPGALSFELGATPPSQLELATEFTTLEFTGDFVNLLIKLTTNTGNKVANLVGSLGSTTVYSLDTVFNKTEGFTQNLSISWDDVESGPNAQTSVAFQGVPSQVPVPAAGLLLLTALGGAAALRRRKKIVAA